MNQIACCCTRLRSQLRIASHRLTSPHIASQAFAFGVYLPLLLRRRLVTWARLLKPPDLTSILPLLRGSAALLMRNMLWNVIMLMRARSACSVDPSGVTAAAYAICLQVYCVGSVFGSAMQVRAIRPPARAHMRSSTPHTHPPTAHGRARGLRPCPQGTASILVAAALASSPGDTRDVARRSLAWGWKIGVLVSLVNLLAIPIIMPLFSPLASVRKALYGPAIVSALVHLSNGFCYASEGIAMGLGAWSTLAKVCEGRRTAPESPMS